MFLFQLYSLKVVQKTSDWLIVTWDSSTPLGRISKHHLSDIDEMSLMKFVVTPLQAILKDCVCLGMEKELVFLLMIARSTYDVYHQYVLVEYFFGEYFCCFMFKPYAFYNNIP